MKDIKKRNMNAKKKREWMKSGKVIIGGLI